MSEIGEAALGFGSQEVQKVLRALKEEQVSVFSPVYENEPDACVYDEIRKIGEFRPKRVEEILEFLSEQGILVKEPVRSYFSCATCDSRRLLLSLACNKCGNQSLQAGRALLHDRCGFIGFEDAFVNQNVFRCPKCGKSLKTLGIDYHAAGQHYKCMSCGDLSKDLKQNLNCAKCGRSTRLEEAVLRPCYKYRVDADAQPKIAAHAIDLARPAEVLIGHGYRTELYPRVKGKSGVEHELDLVAYDTQGPQKADQPSIVAMVILSDSLVSLDPVLSFIGLISDIESRAGVLAVVPGLTAAGRKLALSRGITVNECSSYDHVPTQLAKAFEEVASALRKGPGKSARPEEIETMRTWVASKSKEKNDSGVLLQMIYEKHVESQKIMRKLLEQMEESNEKLDSKLERVALGKASSVS